MPTLISDDGIIKTFLGDDGAQYQVASQFAPPAPLNQPVAPDPGVDYQFPPDDLSQPQPGSPAVQAAPPVAPETVAAPPVAPPQPAPAPVAPAVVEEPVLELPPDDLSVTEAPSIAPTAPLDTPTQVASALGDINQETAETLTTAFDARASIRNDQKINSVLEEAELKKVADEKAAYVKDYQAEEARWQAKTKELVERRASFKIDPNRDRSEDRQAMAWIGVVLAGIGQVIRGGDPGKNPAMDVLFAQLDRNVQLQMAERDTLDSQIGARREIGADMRQVFKTRDGEYAAREAVISAKYARRLEGLKGRLVGVEDREATDIAIQGLKSKQASAEATAAQAEAKAEADAKAARRQAAAAAARAQAAAMEKARDSARQDAKEGVRWDPVTQSYSLDPSLINPKDAALLKKTENEAANSDPNVIRGVGSLTMTGADGKDTPFLARDTTRAAEITTLKAATDTFSQFTQELEALVKKEGWSSDTLKSDAWRSMQTKYASALLEWKEAAKLGVLNGPDLELGERVIGGDPTGVRDPSASLRTARKAMVDKLNHTIQNNTPPGYKTKRYEPVKVKELEEAERSKADDLAIIKAPIARFANAEQRAELVAEKARAIEAQRNKGITKDEIKTLHADLQSLHRSGQITDEELAQLSAKAMFIYRGRDEPAADPNEVYYGGGGL